VCSLWREKPIPPLATVVPQSARVGPVLRRVSSQLVDWPAEAWSINHPGRLEKFHRRLKMLRPHNGNSFKNDKTGRLSAQAAPTPGGKATDTHSLCRVAPTRQP